MENPGKGYSHLVRSLPFHSRRKQSELPNFQKEKIRQNDERIEHRLKHKYPVPSIDEEYHGFFFVFPPEAYDVLKFSRV